MTAEQKAKELIEMFMKIEIHVRYEDFDSDICIASGNPTIKNAKQCALICVDEILKASTIKLSPNSNGKFVYIDDYWQSVRTEIINFKN